MKKHFWMFSALNWVKHLTWHWVIIHIQTLHQLNPTCKDFYYKSEDTKSLGPWVLCWFYLEFALWLWGWGSWHSCISKPLRSLFLSFPQHLCFLTNCWQFSADSLSGNLVVGGVHVPEAWLGFVTNPVLGHTLWQLTPTTRLWNTKNGLQAQPGREWKSGKRFESKHFQSLCDCLSTKL